jgi:hypothetical protein
MMYKWLYLFLSVFFLSCSMNIDEFDESHYRNLSNLHFENQKGNTQFFEDEHLIKVSFPEADSKVEYDYLVIDSIDISAFSNLYLVETKIKTLPEDSLGWDSLSREVSLDSDRLKISSKIMLPVSREFWIAVVAENGSRSLWKVQVKIDGEVLSSSSTSLSSSSSVKDESSSSSAQTGSSSSTKQEDSSSSVEVGDPQILSMVIGGENAVIDQESGRITVQNLPFLSDLKALTISECVFSEGSSSADINENDLFDLSRGLSVTVENESGKTKEYTIKAGYQYANSNFNSWADDYALEGTYWDNGNNDFGDITEKYTSNETVGVKMESKKLGFIVTKFASGNLFTGVFNPKGVSAINMTGYDNGNELIDFGMPFTGRPEYIEVDFTYSGDGDSCDIYIVLENRTLTENQGMNQYRSSSDVNTLVASAWYRATTDEDLSDPDVDSITTNESGFKTLRMKLQYGTPLEGSPIYDTVIFSDQLQNGKGIDNHLVQGTGEEDVTHIRMAMASSAKGDVYKGTVGATLIVDALRLIY